MAHLYQYIDGSIRRYRGFVEPIGREARFVCDFGKVFNCHRNQGVVIRNTVWYENENYHEAIRAFIAKKAEDLKSAYRKAENFEREIDNLCDIQNIEKSSCSNASPSECFENHRKMWMWISENSRSKYVYPDISLALKHFGWSPESIYSGCWACQATILSFGRTSSGGPRCAHCLLDWPNDHCQPLILRLRKAKDENNIEEYAKIAKQIANLPMREEYKDER